MSQYTLCEGRPQPANITEKAPLAARRPQNQVRREAEPELAAPPHSLLISALSACHAIAHVTQTRQAAAERCPALAQEPHHHPGGPAIPRGRRPQRGRRPAQGPLHPADHHREPAGLLLDLLRPQRRRPQVRDRRQARPDARPGGPLRPVRGRGRARRRASRTSTASTTSSTWPSPSTGSAWRWRRPRTSPASSASPSSASRTPRTPPCSRARSAAVTPAWSGPREGGNIWISYSEDLLNWGDWDVVMTPRGGYWDHDRIGLSVPPILTPCGWLIFYYGVKNTPSGPLFRLGVAFLNEEDPREVIGRSNIPLLAPSETYERIGDVQNLVFSCGAVTNTKTGKLELYYGASDSCICLGTVELRHPREHLQGPAPGGELSMVSLLEQDLLERYEGNPLITAARHPLHLQHRLQRRGGQDRRAVLHPAARRGPARLLRLRPGAQPRRL